MKFVPNVVANSAFQKNSYDTIAEMTTVFCARLPDISKEQHTYNLRKQLVYKANKDLNFVRSSSGNK